METETITNIKSALDYLTKYKFSVFPCKQNKKPYISWEEYQKRLPTEEEVKTWWKKYPNANIAVITNYKLF